jgi:anti-sigma factor RsiW
MSTCTDIQTRVAESALGLLDGADRADVLAHLESCAACRGIVGDMSRVADALVLLAPEAEPPLGFERRVLQQLGGRAPARRRILVAVAAAFLVIGGVAAGWSMSGKHSDVRSVAMRTPSGKSVGEAYLHDAPAGWVFVAVPDWRAERTYHLRVSYADGRTADVTGDGVWAATVDSTTAVHRLELVDADGDTWCSSDVL